MRSEKEKMINGEPYLPETNELRNDRLKAKELCRLYNGTPAADSDTKIKILKTLLAECGDKILIEPNFYCDYGYNISAGDCLYINHNCVVLDCAPVTFGKRVCIGPNCGFYTAIHPLNSAERAMGTETAKPITVGNDVWIGGNVTVLPGVSIGDNSVIGAGSVVTKDIPPNVIAFGNPCRVVREITDKNFS